MCGIVGVVDFIGPNVPRAVLEDMVGRLSHRGPDASGVHQQGPVALGHARLSVVDVEGGHQPMVSDDGQLCLSFNGEIFNHIELRRALEREGVRFRTRSDTEVLLRMYEAEGMRCVERLNGQWAFALWDGRRGTLLLSRDRLGIRPLYYVRAGGALVFASEIKALLAYPRVPRALDLGALSELLTFWTPLPSHTLFAGVYELEPGTSMLVGPEGASTSRHFELDFPPAPPSSPVHVEECGEALLALLRDATRLRLRSDVPVGAYLSGGLDSSLIAALAQAHVGDKLRTFSVAFDDEALDERAHQREVVRHLGTTHEELVCSRQHIGRAFPEVVWHAEKPLFRTAPVPLFLLSRQVHESGFKVVLTGEGADEVLGGYDLFKEAKVRRYWAKEPGSSRRPLLLRRLYPYLEQIQAQPTEYLKAFFRVRPEDVASPFFSHLPRWQLGQRAHTFFSDDVRAALADKDPLLHLAQRLPPDFAAFSPLSQAQYLESTLLLPGYILSSQGDRVSMAHAVEGRFPFLDPRVVAFGSLLPASLKLRGLDEKYLLKRVSRGLVPESVRARKKQPYRAPDAASFFDETGRPLEYVRALLDPERIRKDGVFHPGRVRRLLEKAQRGNLQGAKDNLAFIAVLSTQIFLEQFRMDTGAVPGGSEHGNREPASEGLHR